MQKQYSIEQRSIKSNKDRRDINEENNKKKSKLFQESHGRVKRVIGGRNKIYGNDVKNMQKKRYKTIENDIDKVQKSYKPTTR